MAEEKLNIEEEETPLQAKLETIANEIGKIGVYVAILTFIVMTIKLIIRTVLNDASVSFLNLISFQNLITIETLKSVINFVIIGITVIVVAVPEGLPLAVTISLAFSVMKMKEENNLVRKLDASETMGGANEICTDKTGTLTLNRMSVRKIYFLDKVHEGVVSNFNSLPNSALLQESVLFNCSARIEKNEVGELEARGNCTEQGLIRYLMENHVNAYEMIRQKEDRVLQVIPFNSARKRACTVVRHPTLEDTVRVYVKGAPEIVLDLCEKYIDKDGKE